MKKRKIIIFAIVTLLIVVVIFGLYSNGNGSNAVNKTITTEDKEAKATRQDIIETLTAPGEVKSEKEETLKLNTSYYYSTICAEENEIIKEGSNLLKYTNGKYLVAPYDCVISSYYFTKVGNVCTVNHYIKIFSVNDLY